MQAYWFDSLRKRLLRGGVAPRHVHRYLRELQDHHDDALRAELALGADLPAAREAAWARLGTEETLAQGMLDRPELRSLIARFPVILSAGPVLTWLGTPIVMIGTLALLREVVPPIEISAALVDACHALWVFHARILPVLLGIVVLQVAARRRLQARWPLSGAAVVDVLAGTATVYSLPGQLVVNSSLLPWLVPFSDSFGPRDLLGLGEGLLRAAGLLALSVLIQQLTQRLSASDEPTLAAG